MTREDARAVEVEKARRLCAKCGRHAVVVKTPLGLLELEPVARVFEQMPDGTAHAVFMSGPWYVDHAPLCTPTEKETPE